MSKAVEELRKVIDFRVEVLAKELDAGSEAPKGLAAGHILAVGLSARRNMCVHPEVSKEGDRERVDEMCRQLTAPWTREKKTASCVHFEKYESALGQQSQLLDTGIYTIEDLRVKGMDKEYGWCPYYAARRLIQASSVVVLNYQYVLDPKVSLASSLGGAPSLPGGKMRAGADNMAMLGRLVVGLSLFSRTCMAAACGGNDAQIWSQKGSAAFSSDMETCGRQCALASTSCARHLCEEEEEKKKKKKNDTLQVFGCTRDHCKLKCIAGQTAECKACVEAAGCAANFTACSGFTAPSARMPQLMDDCTGSGAPSVPVCYAGSAKELGMKETVQVKVDTFSNNQGTMDLKGSGAETINCLGKTFTKNGQDPRQGYTK
eukprot:g3011.t1